MPDIPEEPVGDKPRPTVGSRHPIVRSSVSLLALLIASVAGISAHAADDTKNLNGTWKPQQAELAGQPLPPPVLKAITLTINGTNYEVVVVTEKGPSPDRGTLVFDPAANPKGMTITGVEGPNAGKTFPAIYELDGDTLRICYDLSGQQRPAEFKSPPATKLYLVTYQRAK
jgi:uncharacterized protein (TIGR03067 family)